MEKLIFYICTFALISFTVGSKLGAGNKYYNTCLTENNVSDDDMLTIRDIIEDKHKQENQERIKKNGCVMQCLLQNEGVMNGSEYDVEKMLRKGDFVESTKLKLLEGLNNCINEKKIHRKFTKRTNAPSSSKIFEALDNCINETKDLTEKCEKSFALTECFLKAEEKLYPSPSPSSGN
ncbi:pheromone-binding protein Gp-9-like isoform X1 [Temnothorax longispinosus]|uniref:pheromone-binding protein Gp-9-like isoform X1 n=1 Tax=Temnothorax longispinosus TaxID=300112 RepID=UPI003A99C6BC